MITIVGAGLGGLVLARILHRGGIAVEVFDGDASLTARHQGGMLDIHEESGQMALRAAGLYDAFRAIVLEEGDAFRILDKSGAVLLAESGNGARPEVDRGALRRLLAESLPDGVVHWGRRLVAATPDGAGFLLRFADGQTHRATTLIGADGAWSKVRPLVSAAVPVYSGISFVEARLERASRYPALAAAVGQGLMFALADGKGIIAHREPDDELCTYAGFAAPADLSSRPVTVAEVLAQFDGWHPDLVGLIGMSDGPLAVRPISALPVGHSWDRRPGVTLLGDAAHLMSPFAGEGANLAMQDGAELALALLAYPGDVETAFAAYEAAMVPRAAKAAEESAASLEMSFGPDGSERMVAFFSQFEPQAA